MRIPLLLLLLLPRLALAQDLPVVSLPASPAEAPVELVLQEQWRIGGDDDEDFFGVIQQIQVDDAGNSYLLDVQLNEVRVHAPDGALLRTIGREGEGPGEFRRPADLLLLPTGEVGVLQRMPARLVLLTPDGEPAGDFPLTSADDGGPFMLSDAQVWSGGLVLSGGRRDIDAQRMEFVAELSAVTLDGTSVHSITTRTSTRDFARRVAREDEPMSFDGEWHLASDGRVYLADDFDAWRIRVFGPGGSELRVLERAYESLPRSDAEIERIRASARGFGRRRGFQMDPSPTHRDIAWIQEGPDGRPWVLSSRGARPGEDGVLVELDRLGAEGGLLAPVRLRGDGDAVEDGLFLRGDRLYVVTGYRQALLALRGGGEEDYGEDEGEPMSVICYHVPSLP